MDIMFCMSMKLSKNLKTILSIEYYDIENASMHGKDIKVTIPSKCISHIQCKFQHLQLFNDVTFLVLMNCENQSEEQPSPKEAHRQNIPLGNHCIRFLPKSIYLAYNTKEIHMQLWNKILTQILLAIPNIQCWSSHQPQTFAAGSPKHSDT